MNQTDKTGSHKQGFTIVELLIVVVVIAILAAITIVAFNGVTKQARASAAQSAAQQIAKKIATYAVTNDDDYPVDLATIGIVGDGTTSYQYSVDNTASPRTYCATVTVSDVSYFISSTQQAPTEGGCPGHGQGGVAAVANLLFNPTFQSDTGTVQVWRNYAFDPDLITAPDRNQSATAIIETERTTTHARDSQYAWRLKRIGSSDEYGFARLPGTAPGSATGYSVPASGVTRTFYFWAYADLPLSLSVVQRGSFGYSHTLKAVPAGWSEQSISVTGNGTNSTAWELGWERTRGAVGNEVWVSGFRVVDHANVPWFSGSTQGAIPDPDLTPSWEGTPHLSSSILSGKAVAAVSAQGGARAILSSRGGRSALRLIRTMDGGYPYAVTTTPVSGSSWFTGLLSVWRDKPVSPGSSSAADLERGTGDWEGGPLIPATDLPATGEWKDFRATQSFSSNTARILMRPPGTVGDSLWFSQAGLFAGDYAGVYHDGDSPNWIWNGAPYASTSTGPAF